MADCRICVQDCSIHEDVWKALKENCRNYKPKPITNADRIRSMSDEELAEWMATVPMSYEYVCPNPIPKECNGGDRETCIQCWLDWLRQEAQE